MFFSQSDKSVTYNKTTMLIEEIEDKKRVYGLEALASYWVHENIQLGASGHYVISEVKGDDGSEDDAAAYDYKGRGRTYTLNYQVKF